MNERKYDTTAENKSQPARKAETGKELSTENNKDFSPGHTLPGRANGKIGDPSIAQSHASILRKAKNSNSFQPDHFLLQLQRQYGNHYVQRVIDLSKKADSDTSVAPEIEQSILQARGSGQALDTKVRGQMESSFGSDFSGVRVHTNFRADTLNRALSSRAFTTGHNIFFKHGEYNPGSSTGRELLAHELTHVVQQTGNVQGKMIVGQTGDKYEQEADRVASAVVQREQEITQQNGYGGKVYRQKDEEKELQRANAEDAWMQAGAEEEHQVEGPVKGGVSLEVGRGPATALVRPPSKDQEEVLSSIQTRKDSSTHRENLIQRDPASIGVGLAAAALGLEIIKSTIATVQQGDLQVTWPTTEVGVLAKTPPPGIRANTVTKSHVIFKYRKTNPISGIEQVNIGLRCTVQYNGPEVMATFGFTAGGARSRLMRDSQINIRNPVSLQTVKAPMAWKKGGVPEIPLIRVPIEVRVNHPWPQSNDNWTFTLLLGGLYGIGHKGINSIQDYEHHEN